MKHFVVVDDSADQIELMQLALPSLRLRQPVIMFSSGESCLAAIEQGLEPWLVLVDVNMPGLDGPSTVARIRRLPAGRLVRIVMMSTSDQPSDVRRALEAGADSYVMKPTGRQSWRDVLEAVISYWGSTDLSGRI